MKELERERLRVREIERAVLEDKEDRGIRRKAEATIEEIVNKDSTIGYLSLQGKGRSRYIYLYTIGLQYLSQQVPNHLDTPQTPDQSSLSEPLAYKVDLVPPPHHPETF